MIALCRLFLWVRWGVALSFDLVGQVHHLIFLFLWNLVISRYVSSVSGENVRTAFANSWNIASLIFDWLWFLVERGDIFEVFFRFMLDRWRRNDSKKLLDLIILYLLLFYDSWHGGTLGRDHISFNWQLFLWIRMRDWFFILFCWCLSGDKASRFNNDLRLYHIFLWFIYLRLDDFLIFDFDYRGLFYLCRRRHRRFWKNRLHNLLRLHGFLLFCWRNVLHRTTNLFLWYLRGIFLILLQIWSLRFNYSVVFLYLLYFLSNFQIFIIFFKGLVWLALDLSIGRTLLYVCILFIWFVDHSL